MEEAVEYIPQLYSTFWALVPPIVAIVLALITKEVYSSLFIGIVIGGLLYSGFEFEGTVVHVFEDGILGVLTDPYNMGIIVFLVVLGIMVALVLMKTDFGSMKLHEDNAVRGDLFTTGADEYGAEEDAAECKGKVIDLIFPIVALIVCCVIGMIYTGKFFSGTGFIEAFSDCDASMGLMLGSFFALVITIVFYMARKVLKFKESMSCVPEGFKAMVPAILILTFAWTLKSMTDSLGAKEFVADLMYQASGSLLNMLPAIIFLVGCFLAFATGTSWGTFGILIPIVVHTFEGSDPTMMIISISACMAGAVCGDHCSPISDTTIMASAGARCNHVNHVSTQIPYVIVVAAVSFVTYVIAGFVHSPVLPLIMGVVMTIAIVFMIRYLTVRKSDGAAEG